MVAVTVACTMNNEQREKKDNIYLFSVCCLAVFENLGKGCNFQNSVSFVNCFRKTVKDCFSFIMVFFQN
jgi:hypothetical protein